jgi:hypothetical protein
VPADPPTDAAAWRTLLATLPARDLLRLAQKDKGRSARLFAGFRPTSSALRNPIVLARLADEALKHADFAAEVLGVTDPDAYAAGGNVPLHRVAASPHAKRTQGASTLALQAPPSPPLFPPAAEKEEAMAGPTRSNSPHGEAVTRCNGTLPPAAQASETRIAKAKLKHQGTALRHKDERIRQLEAELAAAVKQRDGALADAAAADAARRAAEAEVERLRRRAAREERREQQAVERPRVTVVATTVAPEPGDASPDVTLLAEALERLLRRGRQVVVADVCREALTIVAESGGRVGRGVEGAVRRVYAEALAGSADERQRARAEEQAGLAFAAFLDAGDAGGAAGAWAWGAALRGARALRASDAALLARLAALTERTGQGAAVREAFERARVASPEVGGVLRSQFAAGGKRLAPLLAAMGPVGERSVSLGPNEVVTLPNGGAVSAAQYVRAVDGGDAATVGVVRAGLRLLREASVAMSGTAVADALEEAVITLSPAAAATLLQRRAPRAIVVDASNVARHDPDPLALGERSRVASLREMRDDLLRGGWFPVAMIADANLRYHVDDRPGYLRLVEAGIVHEVPAGITADEVILREARERNAPVVTNDRLEDWGEAARGVERFGFLLLPGRVTLTGF